MKSQRKCFRKSGFTLIELVMTIVVVSIVAIPLSLLVNQHLTSVSQSSAYSTAVNLARFEMEKVNNMNYANISSVTVPNYEGYNFDVTRTVAFVQGNAGSLESLKQIRVEVKNAGSSAVLFSLITYLAKNVSYGT
jgi:prepilin-type N-terminal cleavage/methylation domain-containing protein